MRFALLTLLIVGFSCQALSIFYGAEEHHYTSPEIDNTTPSPPPKRRPTSTSTIRTSTRRPTQPTTHQPLPDNLPDFADFQSINGRHVSCNSSQFRCENGRQCILRVALCNGVRDCDDGSDEDILCAGCQDNNGGCGEHQCRNTPSGAECHCNKGWQRSHDGISCEDKDECANGRGSCQHYCHNTQGGFTCSCAPGYILQSDGTTCKLELHDVGQLLFSVGHQVRNLPLNSWRDLPAKEFPETAIICDVQSGVVEGLDTSVNSNYFYTKNGGIYSNNAGEVCLVQGLHDVGMNVAVDWVTGNLYFIDEDSSSMGLCRWDGRFCTWLYKKEDNLGTPRGLALHPKLGIMFWTDTDHINGAKIERANMDGSDRRVIINERVIWPNAVAVDYVHNLLYFADAENNMIERCRLDGSHRETVVRGGVFHPFDMVVFDDHIFWTDWGIYGVMMYTLSNQAEHRSLYHSPSDQPYGLGVFHPAYHQKNLSNPCTTTPCSHICSLTQHPHGHGTVFASCLCPTNYEFRNGSKHECVPVAGTKKAAPHWCKDAFVSACEKDKACENGGKCKIDQEHGHITGTSCQCPQNFGGDYCEVQFTSKPLVDTPETRRNVSQIDCSRDSNHTSKTEALWCTDIFVAACEKGEACENGGVCKISQNQYGAVVEANCQCKPNFAGDFCEVAIPAPQGSRSVLAALLIFFTFILVTCLGIGLFCRYSKYNQKLHALRWTPSVIFRKTVAAARNSRDIEQRQRIISMAEDGSKANLCKSNSESFCNPVYEEVQVPVHSTYIALKRENSSVSRDSDADSGLEFNSPNGSP